MSRMLRINRKSAITEPTGVCPPCKKTLILFRSDLSPSKDEAIKHIIGNGFMETDVTGRGRGTR